MPKTPIVAKAADANGLLYQRRALEALPLLVRQARAGELIYYSALASELSMPNAQNLNYVLGAVGRSMSDLGRAWRNHVPEIQVLAVNKRNALPGSGFIGSIAKADELRRASKSEKRIMIKEMLHDVINYRHWDDVLSHFGLQPAPASDIETLAATAPKLEGKGSGLGESAAHKALKEYVAANPKVVGIQRKVQSVETEFRLPTGDAIDVLFRTQHMWVAVEVKSHISTQDDLERGVFQCVKYEALLSALIQIEGSQVSVATRLAIGGKAGSTVVGLANVLAVPLIESVGIAGRIA